MRILNSFLISSLIYGSLAILFIFLSKSFISSPEPIKKISINIVSMPFSETKPKKEFIKKESKIKNLPEKEIKEEKLEKEPLKKEIEEFKNITQDTLYKLKNIQKPKELQKEAKIKKPLKKVLKKKPKKHIKTAKKSSKKQKKLLKAKKSKKRAKAKRFNKKSAVARKRKNAFKKVKTKRAYINSSQNRVSKPYQSSSVSSSAFLLNLKERIAANKYYPAMARRRGLSGSVTLSFTLMSNGNISLVSASGSPIFIKAAKDALLRAFPIPKSMLPANLPRTFSITLSYNLH